MDVLFDPYSSTETFVGVASESGQIEFFVFAAWQQPKKLLGDITTITGHAPLPPIYSLGFHYSEWAKINTTYIIGLNEHFEELKFPVDVFWMDIGHT